MASVGAAVLVVSMALGSGAQAWAQGAPSAGAPAQPAAGGAPAGALDDAALVARGEYLARLGDCMPCHTRDKAKPYAGGLGLATPFGTLYSVNITSDPKTGIGSWTFGDFKNAVHGGIRKDGAFLYPGMPFDAYTAITEDDLQALWAYVRRIPPVEASNRDNALAFPFNIRMGLLAWRELFFAPAYFKPTAGKSDEWNRGAYLVEALGHCSDCHSPRNLMGAIKGKAQFTGTEIDGFYAPAIDAAALTKAGWTADTLTQFFKIGSAPGRTAVFGPMAEVIRNSTSGWTDADLKAMVTYLFDAPPPLDRPAPQVGSPLAPDVIARAGQIYVDNCMECHQPHGAGKPGVAPNLAGNPAVTAAEPYNILMATLGGLPSDGAYGAMPSFAGRLGDGQIADLANYIRISWGNTAAPNVTAEMVAAWRATAAVPDYGTQAASAFSCPKVGGGPGQAGPDPVAVAAISGMLTAGNDDIGELATLYRNTASDTGLANTVNAVVTAYCPVVAAETIPEWQKNVELKRFALKVSAALAPQTAAVKFPPLDFLWAVPAGRSLVAREPDGDPAQLNCPANDGKMVPQELVAQAGLVLGTATTPVPGDTAANLATALMAKNPKARPSDVANALIAAYCPIAKAAPGTTVAQRRSWLEGFGEQVIETLETTRVAQAK
ncbi:c-type cytochrome [Chelatococcus reniformis]|uniref:c-type cytochrome n=1 Tax=Chelatococcus reniformis TaxID=1494448 RepID=UPI001FCE4769|nr:cytochrome c [Chelatococcus reniformis]